MREILHQLHSELDDRHWWFVARRSIVTDQLRRAVSVAHPRILDIGCGGGATLRELARLGEACGVDPEPGAVEAARGRAGCDVRLGSLPDDMPFGDGSFDVITLLDVLEHVEEDAAALRAIVRLLSPGGILLCTVPAFRFLWSEHDVLNEHYRRYTRRELAIRLRRAGLRIGKISYYNTFLFPPIALARGLRGGRLRGRPDLGEVPAVVNAMLRSIFGAERYWLRYGNLPFGVSVLALARKPGEAE